MGKSVSRAISKARSIDLDLGCGNNKQKGCVGMDMHDQPGVDIVHDIQNFPWPIEDGACRRIIMSHIFEHIEPKHRFEVMDECWRVIRPDGQLLISCPYGGSLLEYAHPAHYMCPNKVTFQFFDPDYPLWHACSYKKPLPWKIDGLAYVIGGTIEVALSPRKSSTGEPEGIPAAPAKKGSVHIIERPKEKQVTWPAKKTRKPSRRRT